MQKFFAAIALILTLTCTLAVYTPYNYAIAPVSVAYDTDFDFTNETMLSLESITPGDIYLVSKKLTLNVNASASYWKLWYRKLNSKTLSTGANNTATFSTPQILTYYNNYAIGLAVDNDTGTYQIRAYQVSLTGGNALPRLTLSTNTNRSFTPAFQAFSMIKKTVYVFYYAADLTVNVTNFVIGLSTVGTPEFTLSTTFDTISSLSVAWGEALGSNQLFAVWVENGVLKDSVLNVSKGTVSNPTIVAGYNKSIQFCLAYATDKKLYGEFCQATDYATGNVLYYVSTNTSTLFQYANYSTNTSNFWMLVPYGPYIALIFQDTTAVSGINYAYEIWDLDAFRNFKNRTIYLNIDSNSTQIPFQVPSGGFYTLLYNHRRQDNGTLTSVKVGLLLESYSGLLLNSYSSNDENSFALPLLTALLILVAVIVAVGIYYYLKKRSSKNQPDESLMPSLELI